MADNTCERCGGFARRLRYDSVGGLWLCLPCAPASSAPAFLHKSAGNPFSPTMTEARKRDIRSRKTGPDGQIFRDPFGKYDGKILYTPPPPPEVSETRSWLEERGFGAD